MKNLVNCRSLIKVAIITMVVALMASQMKVAYAEKIHTILDEINDKLYQLVSAPAPVEKTGQTKKYQNEDDGDLQKGVTWPNPRFEDNGDGTVTDNLTGLIWLKDASRLGSKTWSDALSDCNGLAADGVDLTDGSNIGDWRLPNIRELLSLVNFGVFSPALSDTDGTGQWSNGDPFLNVQSSFYWSSTTNDGNPTNAAFTVFFGSGRVNPTGSKTLSNHVWCVRGGP